MSAASYKMTEMIPSTSAHLIVQAMRFKNHGLIYQMRLPGAWTSWPEPPWRIIVIHILSIFFVSSFYVVRHSRLSLLNNFYNDILHLYNIVICTALGPHFTTTTRILQGLAFLCKLGFLLFKPLWDYQKWTIRAPDVRYDPLTSGNKS